MRSLPKLLAAALLTAALQSPAAARADTDPQQLAAARALFELGTAAMGVKDWDAACPKIEESLKIAPRVLATKLALGACYEGAGRLASSWATFLEAEDAAGREGKPDLQRDAHDRAEALRPKLAQLVLRVLDDVKDLDGLAIHRDGKLVAPAMWNAPIPVDKGLHVVVVEAKGKQTREKHVTVDADGATVEVPIPELRDAGPTAPPEPATPAVTANEGPGSTRDLAQRRGMPVVHVEEPTKQLLLYRVDAGFQAPPMGYPPMAPAFAGPPAQTTVICAVPCDESVDGSLGQEFYLGGVGLTSSSRFRLQDRAGRVKMKAEPGRYPLWLGGVTMTIFGSAGVLVGGPMLAIGTSRSFDANSSTTTGVGGGMLVTGAVLLAIGIPLFLAGRTTYSFEQTGLAYRF